MKLAIIAAGESSRLRAEGVMIPKPLIHVGGMPMIERIIDVASRCGITEVCCIVNDRIAESCRYLSSRPDGPPVTLVTLTTPSSMHSLFALSPLLKDGPFCLTTADSVFREDEFRCFTQCGQTRNDADGLLAITQFIDDEMPLCVGIDEQMRITSFSDAKTSAWATGGLYWFSPEIFALREEALQSGTHRLRNFLRLLLARGYRLFGYPFSTIVDVDHKADIAVAERFLSDQESHGLRH